MADTDKKAEDSQAPSPEQRPEGRSAVLAEIRGRLTELPATPGVYLFKGRSGKVLYVGKAQNLRSRVRSYITGGDGRIRIPRPTGVFAEPGASRSQISSHLPTGSTWLSRNSIRHMSA